MSRLRTKSIDLHVHCTTSRAAMGTKSARCRQKQVERDYSHYTKCVGSWLWLPTSWSNKVCPWLQGLFPILKGGRELQYQWPNTCMYRHCSRTALTWASSPWPRVAACNFRSKSSLHGKHNNTNTTAEMNKKREQCVSIHNHASRTSTQFSPH